MGPGPCTLSSSRVFLCWHVNLQRGKNQGATSDHQLQPGRASVQLSHGEDNRGYWELAPGQGPSIPLCLSHGADRAPAKKTLTEFLK